MLTDFYFKVMLPIGYVKGEFRKLQTINISNEEEMISQVKLLLQNGYDVGVHKETRIYGDTEYIVAYRKPKGSEQND